MHKIVHIMHELVHSLPKIYSILPPLNKLHAMHKRVYIIQYMIQCIVCQNQSPFSLDYIKVHVMHMHLTVHSVSIIFSIFPHPIEMHDMHKIVHIMHTIVRSLPPFSFDYIKMHVMRKTVHIRHIIVQSLSQIFSIFLSVN